MDKIYTVKRDLCGQSIYLQKLASASKTFTLKNSLVDKIYTIKSGLGG